MSENKDFLQKASLISVATLLRDLMNEMDTVKQNYSNIVKKISSDNVLDFEGQIYSFCICRDRSKLERLKSLFDQYRSLLNYEKPNHKFMENLYREIIRQINVIYLDFVNEQYTELVNTQREVIKHLRLIDTTVANADKKKKKKEDDLLDDTR